MSAFTPYFPLLAFVAALAVLGGAAATALVRAPRPFERALAAVQLALVWAIALTRAAGGVGALSAPVILGITLAAALPALWLRRRARRPLERRRLDLAEAAPLAVGLFALAVSAVAAGILPVWQWDAAGYHLPFVNFAVQAHSLRGVPAGVPYLSTYPHSVELAFTALRVFLPDDRWIDAGQLPFALLGGLATAALARRFGARRTLAAGAGALWLGLPAVLAQLPSNYIDVASAACLLTAAAWAVGPVARGRVVLAGLALGVFAGAKANAPVAAALLGGLVAARALRRGHGRAVAVAALLALALGSEAYVSNLVRFGNPLWPAKIQLGPLTLPGRAPVSTIIRAGQDAARAGWPLSLRVAASWLTPFERPVFDMRRGGFGPLGAALLLGAALALRKRARRVALVPLLAAALAPDPSIARYVLGVPALALALSAAAASELGRTARRRVALAATMVGGVGALWGATGLARDLPTARRLLSESPRERELTFGPSGQGSTWAALRHRVGRGVIAYDGSFELPYLLWRHDLGNTVLRIPEGLRGAALEGWLQARHVAAVVAGQTWPAGRLARAEPQTFAPLFTCRIDACAVFARRTEAL